MYGPECTVMWEGEGHEAFPYPDFEKDPPPKAEKETKKYLIERLQKGERCNFSGGLVHHLFLHEIGFDELLAPFPLNPGSTYGSYEILVTLFHSANFGIPSIEALKLVNASELGVLIWKSRSLNKETVREHLGQMAEHNLGDKLIYNFAERLLQRGQIDTKVFFIDGHFLLYYGLKVIAKGYPTVRCLAMRGNELYAVTDLQGRPLFFMTESNEIDFRPIISLCAVKLVELGISRPLLVFDRSGYGIHFFKELSEIADFVTWAKYVGDKSLERIPDESFSVGIFFEDHKYMVLEDLRTVTESIQIDKNEGRTKPTPIKLRLIVLKDMKTG